MDYEGIEGLEQLLRDSNATEFREVLPDIPVDKIASEFYQWVDSDAPAAWGPNYHSMRGALGALVRAEPSYDIAMAEIRMRQDSVRPPVTQADTVSDAEPGQEALPDPSDAATEVAARIGPVIIDRLLQEYPEFASRLTADQLSSAAVTAIGAAISETAQA